MSILSDRSQRVWRKLSFGVQLLGAVCVPVGLNLPAPAWADNGALLQLFEILKSKGSIEQAEYDQLVAASQTSETKSTVPPAQTVPSVMDPVPSQRLERMEAKLKESEAELRALEVRIAESKRSLTELNQLSAKTPKELYEKMRESQWYDNLRFRGYAQFRYTGVWGDGDLPLHVPNDRSVSDTESFMVRRGRLVLSGDVSDRLSIYVQTDFAGSPVSGADMALQMRDFYADIAIDADKEFRFRVGQSKVPFGFSNLQSSQNRAALERPDAFNSAVEGERDIGAFFYWAPKEKRELFKHLVQSGLKGSGDYGVFGIGVYSGQGLNRSDLNGQPHYAARLAYPFQLESGQIMEVGAQAYTGRFVPSTGDIMGLGAPKSPEKGLRDERVALSYILYPQPFGIEAEWTWGRGPQLTNDFSQIDVDSLSGGYIQASCLMKGSRGSWLPFVRYNHYDGARKFGRNAPWDKVRELDVGLEWSPTSALELTLMYTHTFERTNTTSAPYDSVVGAGRLGIQLQWNF